MAITAPKGKDSGRLELQPITADVYTYRGFFSNSGVLILPDGVLVVDTQITPRAGARLRQAIATITDKPIRWVVNTHYHADHAGGNLAFADAEIIASEETARYIVERDEERVEYANTFGLHFQEAPEVGRPTRTFRGATTIESGGERIEIFHAGRVETPDAVVVWWPSRKVLLPGDGVATTDYPYLGVPFLDEGLQDDGQWIGFLRRMMSLEPEVLIAGHGLPLVGRERIRARLELLIELFTDLFAVVHDELAAHTPFPQLVERADERLHRYRAHADLSETVVSQRFAIYRAYNSANPERRGRGWWDDLRPSVVHRVPRAEAEAALAAETAASLPARILKLGGKRPDLTLSMLELAIARAPEDAQLHGLLADLLFRSAAGTKPVVDSTEFIRWASKAGRRALELDPSQPYANLAVGCVEVWSAMVAAEPMDPGIDKLERAMKSGSLDGRQRQQAAFFLGKAHQYEGRDGDSNRWLRRALPAPLRFAYPLVRGKLRSIP